MTKATNSQPERISHELCDVQVTYADGATIEVERLLFHYPSSPKHTRRDWTVELTLVGKRQLLPALHESGVSPLSVEQLIRFTINDPITLEYKPHSQLAARLDMVEDESALVSVDAGLDERVRQEALDLRNYEFESGVQVTTS